MVIQFPTLAPENKFVRRDENVNLAINTKESWEVMTELFRGNHLFTQDRIGEEVKLMKMIDLI